MTLDPSILRSGLSPVFDPRTMPVGDPRVAARAWLRAYRPYASAATAGALIPVFSASDEALLSAVGGTFASGFDAVLDGLWASSVWSAPGFTGAAAPSLRFSSVKSRFSQELLHSSDPGQGLRRMVEALHTYTLGIIVSAVNLTTGAVVPIPVT